MPSFCLYGSWGDFSAREHFGGSIGWIEPNQAEYWTVNVQTVLGGTNDTVLYPMSLGMEIQGFDDDSGVGRMSRWTRASGKDVEYFLVGTYEPGSWGYTDVIANDMWPDVDGDTVGVALEAELGTCDSASTSPGCSNVTDKKDSDHDGLTDFHETFGKDVTKFEWFNALHLPAWGADPRRKDVFIEQDWMDSTVYYWHASITSNPFTEALADQTQAKYSVGPGADVRNLSGENGISLHFDIGDGGNPCPTKPKLCGGWGQGGTRITSTDHNVTRVSDHAMHTARNGVFRHLLIFGVGGQADGGAPGSYVDSGLGPFWGADPSTFHPKAVIHELGHSLGLSHAGWGGLTDGVFNVVNCKPHYNSLMNYAYDVNWSVDSAKFNFSLGSNTTIIDPARVSETANVLSPYDGTRLAITSPSPTTHWFPQASAGTADWNRSNTFADAPTTGAVRSSIIGGPTCGGEWHYAVNDVVAPMTDVNPTVGPDVAAFESPSCSPTCQRLYIGYANLARSKVLYRWSAHTGNRDNGGCGKAGSTGAPFQPCHEFSATGPISGAFEVPYVSGVVTSVSVLEWKGKLVVAYRTNDGKIWVNVATGSSEPGGELTGWSNPPKEVTSSDPLSLADSIEIELSPMYVSTAQGYPASELLAIFYTSGTGSAAVHRMHYTASSTADPLGAWAREDVKHSDGTAVPGGVTAGVTVWPGRSASGANYSAVGYACGVFPGVFVPGTTTPPAPPRQPAKLLCFDKSTRNRWTDLTASSMPGVEAFFRRPGIAFHSLRAAAPAGSGPLDLVTALDPSDPTKGQFFVVSQDSGWVPHVRVGTMVGQYTPPSSTMKLQGLQTSHLFQDNALALFADRDVSAIKAVGVRTLEVGNSFELAGIFDAAYHVNLKDQNDFRVMEHGTCVGLLGSTACGTTSCFDYCWGVWPCPSKPAECP